MAAVLGIYTAEGTRETLQFSFRAVSFEQISDPARAGTDRGGAIRGVLTAPNSTDLPFTSTMGEPLLYEVLGADRTTAGPVVGFKGFSRAVPDSKT